MKLLIRSIVTAIVINAAVVVFSIYVLAPMAPCVVGRPVVDEQRVLKLSAAKQLRIENPDGMIQVRTAQPDTITVNARIRVYASRRSANDIARTYATHLLKVTNTDEGLIVATEPEDRPDALNLIVDYSVQVPESTDLAIDNGNGNVTVTKGCGAVTVRGRNTDIEIVEPEGAVVATSTNGQIKVRDAEDDTTLETVNGSIFANTGNGTLKARTTNGAIVARVLTDNVKECSLTSQNGGITVVAASTLCARVNARTSRGRIRNDIPLTTNVAKGCKNERHIRGIVGGDENAQTLLTISALNGNIWIARND